MLHLFFLLHFVSFARAHECIKRFFPHCWQLNIRTKSSKNIKFTFKEKKKQQQLRERKMNEIKKKRSPERKPSVKKYLHYNKTASNDKICNANEMNIWNGNSTQNSKKKRKREKIKIEKIKWRAFHVTSDSQMIRKY